MEIVVLIAAIIGLVTAVVNLVASIVSIGKKKTTALQSDDLDSAISRGLNSSAFSIFYSHCNRFIQN